MNEPSTALGFARYLAQADAVGIGLLVLLAAMSVIAWTLIVAKGIAQVVRTRRGERFLARFWNARSLDDVSADIDANGVRDPFAHLAAHAMHARAHHARFGASRLEEAGTAQELVARTMRKVLDEENTRMENGLTALATIGATAPFVGLFGTVWGIYHALQAIGASGTASLDRVAGPVGEALIMTAIGLAVAVPAVVAYNAIGRGNRVMSARLDGFAFELATFLATGQSMRAPRDAADAADAADAPRAAHPPVALAPGRAAA